MVGIPAYFPFTPERSRPWNNRNVLRSRLEGFLEYLPKARLPFFIACENVDALAKIRSRRLYVLEALVMECRKDALRFIFSRLGLV